MATPREAVVIQMEPIVAAKPIQLACAICLIKNRSAAKPAESGKMRCADHALQCGTCFGAVATDAHFCCDSCWKEDRTGGVRPEVVLGRSSAATAEFFKARTLEEGEVLRNTPPTSPSSDDTVISF